MGYIKTIKKALLVIGITVFLLAPTGIARAATGNTCLDGSQPKANGLCADGNCPDGSQPDSNGNCGAQAEDLSCGAGSFDWIACPVMQMLRTATQFMDNLIIHTLDVDVKQIFDTGPKAKVQNDYYAAWNSFRVLAMGILLIGGLIMVIAQALGMEVFDAYTIRKVLPRLLIAVIGITLSWQLMRFVINFFDVLGFDVRSLIYAPFKNINGSIDTATAIFTSLATIGAVAFAGFPAVLMFVLGGFISVFLGFLVLVFRQIAIILLVISAPVAIACYILPNTQKAWKMWYDNFLALMFMFPLTAAFIAASHVFSTIALATGGISSEILGIVAYFLPYLMLLTLYKTSKGLVGAVAGYAAHGQTRMNRGLARMRNRSASNTFDRVRAGKRFKNTDETTRTGRFKGRVGTALQAASHAEKLPVNPRRWGARLDAVRSTVAEQQRDKMLEDAEYTWKGDDELNRAASLTSNREELRQYLSTQHPARYAGVNGAADLDRDTEKVERMRTRYGTQAFRQASLIRAIAGGTAHDGPADWLEDAVGVANGDRGILASLVAKGRSTAMEAGRVDWGGAGFGDTLRIAERLQSTPGYTVAQANADLATAVVDAQGPGVLTHASMKPQAIRNLIPEFQRRLQEAYASGDQDRIDRQLAYIASIHDGLSASSPNKAREYADGVMLWDPGNGQTVKQSVEDRRGSEVFQSTRREYQTGLAAAGAAAAGAGGPPGAPPGAPPGGPPGP